MTLGVIDEFRKKGIGKILIDRLYEECQQYSEIKFIYLHVISYNEAAIRFYEKNAFKLLETIDNYYHIENNTYQAKVLGIYINGG